VLFSYIIFNPWQTLIVFVIPVPAIIFAFLFVAYSIYAGKQRADGDNVNHEAHIAGGVTGIIYTIILIPDAVQIFLNNLLGGF
jgi:membrane associated rhomboid family serine protease